MYLRLDSILRVLIAELLEFLHRTTIESWPNFRSSNMDLASQPNPIVFAAGFAWWGGP